MDEVGECGPECKYRAEEDDEDATAELEDLTEEVRDRLGLVGTERECDEDVVGETSLRLPLGGKSAVSFE